MIAYVDSSVLLRLVLGQQGALAEWTRLDRAVASALVSVECLRTLDRIRLPEAVQDSDLAARRESIFRALEVMEIVEPTRAVLDRASQPFPTALRTLDAIHLATALLWREHAGEDLLLATHHSALAMAARASGLRVIGV